MQGPVAAYLLGDRLHLQHGPIDLIIGVTGAREAAFEAAKKRFATILEELVSELPLLRQEVNEDTVLQGAVANRMLRAARPFAQFEPLSPMIAVAGAVADEVLNAMVEAAPLTKAYVNNGGDIARYQTSCEKTRIAISGDQGQLLGYVTLDADASAGGLATSGQRGRSLSRGIADSVTVLAANAATADAAATLIANAVDLRNHPGIARRPAEELQPESDLRDRLVVTSVPSLAPDECNIALTAGEARARTMLTTGLIEGAALFLQGASRTLGRPGLLCLEPEPTHV